MKAGRQGFELMTPHILREPNPIIVLLFIENISHSDYTRIVSKKTQAEAVFLLLFSIFHGEVITQNLGHYQADMTISLTALNQSNLLKYSLFQQHS